MLAPNGVNQHTRMVLLGTSVSSLAPVEVVSDS